MKIPKNEVLWCTYNDTKGAAHHIVTSNLTRDMYFMYEVVDSEPTKKIGKARTPTELEDKFLN